MYELLDSLLFSFYTLYVQEANLPYKLYYYYYYYSSFFDKLICYRVLQERRNKVTLTFYAFMLTFLIMQFFDLLIFFLYILFERLQKCVANTVI